MESDSHHLAQYFNEASLEEKYYLLDSCIDSFLLADALITRSIWVDDFLKARPEKGEFARLFPDLLIDEQKFFKYFRMHSKTFFFVLEKIKHRIIKEDTNYRKAICPEERFMLTLRYATSSILYY